MSTTTYTGTYGGTLDVSQTAPIPMSRLVRVELRKMVDTRAAFWLMLSTALITALVMVIVVWVAAAQDLVMKFSDFLGAMSMPMGVFLPVLGVMLVTQEWGQRTAMVTFSLVPRRSRIVTAKLLVGLIVAVAAVVIALILATIGMGLVGALGTSPDWNGSIGIVLGFLALQIIGLGTGFAFGMLFMNTAAAIVVYFVYSFVLPGIFAIGAELMDWFSKLQPWIDFGSAQTPLVEGSLTGKETSHLLVSGLIWLVLPLCVGIWRMLRAEVK